MAALRAFAIEILPGFVAGTMTNLPVSELRSLVDPALGAFDGSVWDAVAIPTYVPPLRSQRKAIVSHRPQFAAPRVLLHRPSGHRFTLVGDRHACPRRQQ